MKNVILSKNQLIAELSEFRKNVSATGTAFGSVVYFVDESGSKTVNKQKVLQKLVRVAITLGSNYEGRINRDLAKNEEEANFTAQSMSGKKHLNDEGVLLTDTKTETNIILRDRNLIFIFNLFCFTGNICIYSRDNKQRKEG